MLRRFITLVICACATVQASRPQCGLYGAPPCLYVPAPPGQTPACAKPGKTYCENVPQYPKRIVHNLLHRYGYDISKLLVDETADTFGATLFQNPAVFGPDFSHSHRKPHQPPSKPSYAAAQPSTGYDSAPGYAYPNPNRLQQQQQQHPGYDYSPPHSNPNNIHPQGDPIYIPKPSSAYSNYAPHTKPINDQRYVYEIQRAGEYHAAAAHQRYARSADEGIGARNSTQMEFLDVIGSGESNHTRTKRQSFGRSTLCEVNTQFIMPQAALNNQGNWMYVINQNNQAKQLVKAETCASSVCSNLCQLPNTYTSRCEQKFIQKRLIALNADGQNFYTDTFWLPSCCVCTISNL